MNFTVEVRTEISVASAHEAVLAAGAIAAKVDGRVTAIFDEDWEEL